MDVLEIIDMNKDFLKINVHKGLVDKIREAYIDFKWKSKALMFMEQVHMAHREVLLDYADEFNITRTNISWMLTYQRLMNDWMLEAPDIAMSPSGKYLLQFYVDRTGQIKPVFEEVSQLY